MDIDVLIIKNRSYGEILNIQKRFHNEVKNGRKGILILAEHNPVFTLGRNADKSNILISNSEIKKKNIEIFCTKRGGDVTYHGPGQVTGYPIVNLKNFKMGIKDYINSLQDIFILLLKEVYGIGAYKGESKKTGVWVNNSKICAVGVEIKRYVTMHGFAFNINTDLEFFNFIIPCGIKGSKVTSVKSIKTYEVDLEKAFKYILIYFLKVFNIDKFNYLE